MASRPLRHLAVRTVQLRKQFLNEDAVPVLDWYDGTVTAYNARTRCYRVTYTDGDSEDMSWQQLRQHMVPLQTDISALATAAKPSAASCHSSQQQRISNGRAKHTSTAAKAVKGSQPAERSNGKHPKRAWHKQQSASSSLDCPTAGNDQQTASISGNVQHADAIVTAAANSPLTADSEAAAAPLAASAAEETVAQRSGTGTGQAADAASSPAAAAAAAVLQPSICLEGSKEQLRELLALKPAVTSQEVGKAQSRKSARQAVASIPPTHRAQTARKSCSGAVLRAAAAAASVHASPLQPAAADADAAADSATATASSVWLAGTTVVVTGIVSPARGSAGAARAAADATKKDAAQQQPSQALLTAISNKGQRKRKRMTAPAGDTASRAAADVGASHAKQAALGWKRKCTDTAAAINSAAVPDAAITAADDLAAGAASAGGAAAVTTLPLPARRQNCKAPRVNQRTAQAATAASDQQHKRSTSKVIKPSADSTVAAAATAATVKVKAQQSKQAKAAGNSSPWQRKQQASGTATAAAGAGVQCAPAPVAAGAVGATTTGPQPPEYQKGCIPSKKPNSSKDATNKGIRARKALERFPPARVLEEAYNAAVAAVVARLQADPAAVAAAAADVVMAPGGDKPLWDIQADEMEEVADKDIAKHFKTTACRFERGKEPWRKIAAAALLDKATTTATITPVNSSTAAKGSIEGARCSGSNKQAASKKAAVACNSMTATVPGTSANPVSAGKVVVVMDEPFADADAALANAVKTARDEFWREYRLATVTEAERVAKIKTGRAAAAGTTAPDVAAAAGHYNAATEGKDQQRSSRVKSSKDGSKGSKQQGQDKKEPEPSQRPDRVAESIILESGRAVNDRDSWGHVPGMRVNSKFELRSETSVLGLHKSPLAGIVTGELPGQYVVNGKVYKNLKAAISVCMSGIYEDDRDADSGIITLIGEGGNNLLGNKKQVANQKLIKGNRALLVNIAMGLPVRRLRRNDDKSSTTGSALFYDGLYDVVSVAKTRGKEGLIVHAYGLKRREGQEASLSKPIVRFKGVGTAKRVVCTATREHIICKDISKGKEALPVVVVNEVDRELPPGLKMPEDKEWIIDDKSHKDGPLVSSTQELRYIIANEYDTNVQPPQPPRVVEEGTLEWAKAEVNDQAAAASSAAADQPVSEVNSEAGMARARLRIRGTAGSCASSICFCSKELVVKKPNESPHELLARVNSGYLPYETRLVKDQKSVLAVSRNCSRVLIECGDWTGCRDPNCKQRQVARGLRHRLEVFKTSDGRGWAVRSWDAIKAGSLVCIMWGKINRAEDVGDDCLYNDSSYFFDMTPRSDFALDGTRLPEGESLEQPVRYILCARDQGGVARFINHSCNPNLYVQPICVAHTDTDMVAVGLFAAVNIPSFAELLYDYGQAYIEHNLEGVCLCGADCCKFKPAAAHATAAPAASSAGA